MRFRFPSFRVRAPIAPSRCIYKEFGIKLNFTPTIAGDIIRLKVAPEVSTLDFANGITLQGFRDSGALDEARHDQRRAP